VVRRAALLLALAGVLLLPAGRAVAQEPVAVAGSGTPAEAPRLQSGGYTDTIREPETLWYAVEAAIDQTVAASIAVRGRADGPSSQRSEVRVELFDAQRQPSGDPQVAAFTGVDDTIVQIVGNALPRVENQDIAYLAVSLASPEGVNDLRDAEYTLEFAVQVSGEAGAPLTEAQRPLDQLQPTVVTSPPPSNPVGALLPVVLIALAVGGFAGFEGTKWWLRRRY
jgi:hypothetical protein